MKVAFAGLRHGHIYTLYEMIKEHPEFEILGGFEQDDKAREDASSHGISCHYQSYEELLSDTRVETLVLGGCYGDRGRMAIQAIKADKNVIADKPLCTSLAELNKIEILAQQHGKVVSCMYTMRFEPKMVAVRNLVKSGVLGEINNVYFGGQHPLMYGRRPMWYFEEHKHGGVINDIGIHGVDILSYILGLEIQQVNAARVWNKYAEEQPQFKDSAQFMLTAENGAGVLADVSYAIPDGVEFELPYYWQFYIWGTKGTLRFSISEKTLDIAATSNGVGEGDMLYYVKGEKDPLILKAQDPATDYLTDFLRVVKGQKDAILPTQDVLNSAKTTLLIQQLADSRC